MGLDIDCTLVRGKEQVELYDCQTGPFIITYCREHGKYLGEDDEGCELYELDPAAVRDLYDRCLNAFHYIERASDYLPCCSTWKWKYDESFEYNVLKFIRSFRKEIRSFYDDGRDFKIIFRVGY